jgi:hypothetical protein
MVLKRTNKTVNFQCQSFKSNKDERKRILFLVVT